MSGAARPIHVAVVVGEHSGDQLGFKLMRALKQQVGPRGIRFSGLAGEAMQAEGMESLFPLADIAVMGIMPVLARLPTIVKRVYATVDSVVAAKPDILVIIDSPDFTHAVAKRVRRRLPSLPIVDYVSPSVWAWRQGRAKKMRAYVDHVLALLPFEPEAHRRLGGPACTYVGHPLIERLDELRGAPGEQAEAGKPVLLVLPGSRRSEISRLLQPFGETVGLLASRGVDCEVLIPAVTHLEAEIRAAAANWAVQPRIVLGEAAKLSAFRSARAALAASGTVTLELALARVPMVVAYRYSWVEDALKFLVKVHSIVLPNLILGGNTIPELLQADSTPERLADALLPLLGDTPQRSAQLAGFGRLDSLMTLPEGDTPSERAARVVLQTLSEGRA